jgi:hypothetical protein
VGLVLSATGKPAGSVVLLRRTIIEQTSGSIRVLEPIPLSAVFNPVSNKIFLGIVQLVEGSSGGAANYYFSAVNSKLNGAASAVFRKLNATPVNTSEDFVWGLKLAVQSGGSGFAVFVDTSKIRLRNLNAAGGFVGSTKLAFQNPKANTQLFHPDLVFANGAAGERALLVAMENVFSDQGQARLWAQVLAANGLRLGAPVQVDITGSTDSSSQTVLGILPHSNDSSTYPFLAVYTLFGFVPPGQTFVSSGLVLLKTNVTFP